MIRFEILLVASSLFIFSDGWKKIESSRVEKEWQSAYFQFPNEYVRYHIQILLSISLFLDTRNKSSEYRIQVISCPPFEVLVATRSSYSICFSYK